MLHKKVGTFGGGRKTFDAFPEIASVTLKLPEASSACRSSYEIKFGCALGGIVLEWTVDLQTKNMVGYTSIRILKNQSKPSNVNINLPTSTSFLDESKDYNIEIQWNHLANSLPWKGDMLPCWRNNRSTFPTVFLKISKLLSELAYSTAFNKYVINHRWEQKNLHNTKDG